MTLGRALLVTLTVAFTLAGVIGESQRADVIGTSLVGTWLIGLSVLGYVISRHADVSRLGWLLLIAGPLGSLGILSQTYAQLVYQEGYRGLPFPAAAGWLSQWLTLPTAGVLVLLFLRFPDDRLPSRRWGLAQGGTILAVVVGSVALALRPGPLESVPQLINPAGVPVPVLAGVAEVAGGVVTFAGLATVASLILRFVRSSGVERQQMKWLVYPLALIPIAFTIGMLLEPFDKTDEEYIGFFVIWTPILLIPVGMGIAILRYRLYEIDVVIRKTLLYAGLTLGLALVYVGLVFALRPLLSPVTGDSDLAVAASTLAVAALFRPFRARFQAFIDRRFYRSRYDSRLALDRFSASLRHEVQLTSVEALVSEAVRKTVHPQHASMWLRSPR